MALTKEDLLEIEKHLNSEEAKKARAKEIEENVAAALKGANLGKLVGDAVTKAVSGVEEKLTAASKAAEKPPEKGADKNASDPAFAKLQAELEAVKTQAKTEGERREQAEAKAKQDRLESAFLAAVGKAGVPAEKAAIALSHAIRTGLLTHDPNDKPGMKFTRKWGDEVVTLEKGLDEWLKTDEGKTFVPPRGAAGTGEGNGGRVSGKTGSGATPTWVNDKGEIDESAFLGRVAAAGGLPAS